MNLQYIFLLILVFVPSSVLCYKSVEDDPYYRIATGGLTPILWLHGEQFDKSLSNLSTKCASSLLYVYNGMHRDGTPEAYKLLDASSKISSGVLLGTTATFGNYDGCLALRLPEIGAMGQYCTVTMALQDPGNSSTIGSLYYKSLPYLSAFDLSFGLCFPSTCTRDEIESFTVSRTSRYPLKLAPYKEFPLDFDAPLTCETLEETTLLYRLKNLSRAQLISLIILCIFPIVVGVSSFLTLVGVKGRINDFSAQETIKHLIEYKEPTDGILFGLEAGKTFIIIAGCLGHSILPVEKSQPIGYINSPEHYIKYTGTWQAQPWNDGLLGVIPFVAGFGCYKFYSSRIASGSLNYLTTIFSRYIRLVIAVAVAIPLEYAFPLIGDGPIFKLATDRFIRDCDLNWWKHLILDVHSPQTKYCAMYLYMGSIDIKLLVIGFIILWIFKRSGHKVGLGLCALVTLVSCMVMHEQVKHLEIPTFISNPADLKLIKQSLYATHFILSYYLPGFVIGIVTAYVIENNIFLYKPSLLNSFLHYSLFNVWVGVTLFAPGLHTILDVVPRWAFGLFIVAHRMMYFIGFSTFSILLHHCTFFSMKSVPTIIKYYFFYNGKIAASTHLINLLFIRYHFYTMRQIESVRLYDVVARWISCSFIILLVVAVVFHIIVVGPMLALVPKSRKPKSHVKDN